MESLFTQEVALVAEWIEITHMAAQFNRSAFEPWLGKWHSLIICQLQFSLPTGMYVFYFQETRMYGCY